MWSRLDFQTNGRLYGQAAFNELVAILPSNAHTLYYKDEIGNISTSNVRQRIDKVRPSCHGSSRRIFPLLCLLSLPDDPVSISDALCQRVDLGSRCWRTS